MPPFGAPLPTVKTSLLGGYAWGWGARGEGGGKGGNLQRRVKGWKRSIMAGGVSRSLRWSVTSLTEASEQVRAVSLALGNGDTVQRLRS